MYKVQEFSGARLMWKDAILEGSTKGWDTCSFSTKREAEIYAFLWSGSTFQGYADEYAPVLEIGVPWAYREGIFNIPVVMRIVEVENDE